MEETSSNLLLESGEESLGESRTGTASGRSPFPVEINQKNICTEIILKAFFLAEPCYVLRAT